MITNVLRAKDQNLYPAGYYLYATFVIEPELILIRTQDQKEIYTASKYTYIKSSVLTKNWLMISNGNKNLQIAVNDNTSNVYAVLPLGSNLSPYYVAYNVTQQIKAYKLECTFMNGCFYIYNYNGDFNDIVMVPTANDGAPTMQFPYYQAFSKSITNSYSNNITLSGLYTGLDKDIYYIKVMGETPYTVTPGENNVYRGTVSVAGNFDSNSSITYTVTTDTTNGNIAYRGINRSPKFSVSSTGYDTAPVGCEILSYDAWHEIGTKGVRIKFSDYPFGNGDTFQINCQAPSTADGTNNSANQNNAKFAVFTQDKYYSPITLTSNVLTLPKGLSLTFDNGTYTKGDTFIIKVFAASQQDISQLNLGATEIGEGTVMVGARYVVRQGSYGLKTFKVALDDLDNIIDFGYAKSFFKVGTVGKVNPKNGKEVATSSDFDTAKTDFYFYLDYWDQQYFVEIGCGNPIYASDPFYVAFKSSLDEQTNVSYPKLKIAYTLR